MVQPDLGRFAWTLVHRLSGELSHSGARLESRKLERMHVRLSDLAPHHLAAEAVRIAKSAAGDKNVEVFSPTIGRQLLDRGLIDEIDLHLAPVLLGDGIRLYDNPGAPPVRLSRVGDDPTAAVNVRYRPVRG